MASICSKKIERLEKTLISREVPRAIIYGSQFLRYFLGLDTYGFIYLEPLSGRREVYVSPIDNMKALLAIERCGIGFELVVYGRLSEMVEVYASREDRRDLTSIVKDIVESRERIGINREGLSGELLSFLEKTGKAIYLDEVLRELRSVKLSEEIELISAVAHITDRSLERLLSDMRESHRVSELKAIFIENLYRNGAEYIAFDPIIAVDEDSSHPHPPYPMRNRDRPIGKASVLLIDVGGGLNGYVSDMTRTVLLSSSSRLREMAEFLEDSYWTAIDSVSEGVEAREVDLEARRHLSRLGLHKYFIHSIGHGVGIEVHEAPYLSPYSKDVLRSGNVFTVEPGIYFREHFGMRVENTVAIVNGKTYSFMRTPLVIY